MRETGVVRWHLGDSPEEVQAAKPYLGEARVQLGIMKNLMAMGNQQQGARAVMLPDGTVIRSQSVFGQDVVQITPTVQAVVAQRRVHQAEPTRMKQTEYAVAGAVWADAAHSHTVPAVWYSATRRIVVPTYPNENSTYTAAAPGMQSSVVQYTTTTTTSRAICGGQYVDYTNMVLPHVSNDGRIFAGWSSPPYNMYNIQFITEDSSTGVSAILYGVGTPVPAEDIFPVKAWQPVDYDLNKTSGAWQRHYIAYAPASYGHAVIIDSGVILRLGAPSSSVEGMSGDGGVIALGDNWVRSVTFISEETDTSLHEEYRQQSRGSIIVGGTRVFVFDPGDVGWVSNNGRYAVVYRGQQAVPERLDLETGTYSDTGGLSGQISDTGVVSGLLISADGQAEGYYSSGGFVAKIRGQAIAIDLLSPAQIVAV